MSLLDTFVYRATLVFSQTPSRDRLSLQRYQLDKSSIQPAPVYHRQAQAVRTSQSDNSCSFHAHHDSCLCHIACSLGLWVEASLLLSSQDGTYRNLALCHHLDRPSYTEPCAFLPYSQSMTSKGHPRRMVVSFGSCSLQRSLSGCSNLSCRGRRNTQLSLH